MKKIIIVIFSLVFLSSNAIANDLSLTKFHEWLFENGHTEYVNIEQKPRMQKINSKTWFKSAKGMVNLDEPKVKTNEWFWLEC